MMKPMHLEKTDMSKMTAIVVLSLLALPAWSQAPASPSKSAQAKAKPVPAKTVKTAKAIKPTKPQLAKTPVAPVAEPEAQMGPDELAIADWTLEARMAAALAEWLPMHASTMDAGLVQHMKNVKFDSRTETLEDPSLVKPATMSGCGSVSCS